MGKEQSHIDINFLTRFLAGEASIEEEKHVQAWLNESEANRAEFSHLEKTWNKVSTIKIDEAIDIDKEWLYHQQKLNKIQKSEPRFIANNFLKIAASVILIFSLSFITYVYLAKEGVQTQMAETREFKLPDGSIVTLNAGSKISFDRQFGTEIRQLQLKGEAYFDVVRDTLRPFIIQTANTEIRVLGTAFNVKAYKKSSKIEVTVTEGAVSLADKKIKRKYVIAKAGEKAEFNKSSKVVKKTINDDRNFLAWKTRSLIFENDPLSKVARIIEQVYHKQVVIDDPLSKSCRITAQFEDKELETVLNVIKTTLDINVEEEDNVIYLKGHGCN